MSMMMPTTRSKRQVKQEAKLGHTIFEHLENSRQRPMKAGRSYEVGSGYITYRPARQYFSDLPLNNLYIINNEREDRDEKKHCRRIAVKGWG